MKVLSVAGVGSGSGKTTLMARLIAVLPGWGALKTSPVRPGGHDHGLTGDYDLVTNLGRLSSSGTDTRRYIDSGAARVAWLIARPPLSAAAAEAVRAAFGDLPGLLVEGDSLAEGLRPGKRYRVSPAMDEAAIEGLIDEVRAWARR